MSGNLDWRWIGIGVAIMFGLNIVASLIIAAVIGGDITETATTPEEAVAAMGGGRLLLGAVISILSFAIGGYIVGLKSPGRTILEPGISAAIAVVIGLVISGALTPANLLLGGLVPFLAGLAGGYLGERQQSSSAVVRS
jgi:hypothetical protein